MHSMTTMLAAFVFLFCGATVAAPAKTVNVTGFDSAAIKAAIERTQAGDTVRLPAGSYSLTEAVRLKSGTRLLGAGEKKTLLLFCGEKPAVFMDLGACEDVEVAHLTLEGDNNPNAYQGIVASKARRLNIHHVTIRNLVKSAAFGPHGILFSGTNPTKANGVTDSEIADCTFESIGVDSAWGAGIRLAWGSSRNRILRNTIRDTGRGGILADNGSTDLVIRGNAVTGSGGEGLGIEVWGGCDRAVIEDNRLDHWLSIGGSDYCAVRRNVISDKSGMVKFIGIEGIGSYCVITDNLVDDGQQIGLSVSGASPKNYHFVGYNTFQNCIQWAAQFQGEKGGIAYHYFYRCRFNDTTVGRGKPSYPGYEGHGFRTNGNVNHLVLEECEFARNGRYGVQLGGGKVDSMSFVGCTIADNKVIAVADLADYTALEWTNCLAKDNGNNALPTEKPFPHPPPTASFESPKVTRVDRRVSFVSDSRASEGTIAAVLWDFGDGQPSTDARASHAYTRPGKYRVTLIVWDEAGRGSRAEKWLRVLRKK